MSEWDAFPVANKAASTVSPTARDFAVRTMIGEAADEPDEGLAAVGHVIMNRVRAGKYGKDIPNVVLARNQFEPWSTRAAELRAIPQDAPAYQRAASIFDRIAAGESEDPTRGATHFLNPDIVRQRRPAGDLPLWARGEPLTIGRHAFFAPEGAVTDASASRRADDWSSFPAAAPVAAVEAPPVSSPPETGGRFTDNPGQNFRVAREGGPDTATIPPTFLEKLVELWENPPKDKLSLVGMIRAAYEGATAPGDAAAGKFTVTPEMPGKITEADVVREDAARNAMVDRSNQLAAVATPAKAPGGFVAREVLPKPAAVNVAPPTAAALKTAAKEGFESEAVKGLEVAPRAINEFATRMRAQLTEAGIDEVLAPATSRILAKLEGVPAEGVVTGQNLHTLRRTFQQAAGSVDKTERMAAKKVIDAIDDMIPNIAARDILSGDPKAAAQAWTMARGNYAAALRSEDIAKAVLKAQRQADAAGSGANIDNATRQNFKAILNNDKKLRGFNEEEIAQMEAVVRGTTWGNVARLVGKAAPTGIVSGALSGGAGYMTAGPVGGILVPIAGLIGKRIGDRSTASQVQALDDLVRSRAPLMKAMEDAAAKVAAIESQGRSARTMSALAIASRNLASNLKDAGINLSPTEILRSLQGPLAGRAEGDQPN